MAHVELDAESSVREKTVNWLHAPADEEETDLPLPIRRRRSVIAVPAHQQDEDELALLQKQREASIFIQRTFRNELAVYRFFGADLFVMFNGGAPPFGTINFSSSLTATPAKFLACSDSASPVYLANLMKRQWRLAPPEVILSVVGSAQDFTLEPQLQLAFADGLARVASASRAWILTGGTDTGVMKMTGTAMQAIQLTLSEPAV